MGTVREIFHQGRNRDKGRIHIQILERKGIRNLLNVVGKEIKMEGFVLNSYWHRYGEFAKQMEEHVKQGKIKSKIQINHGIESFLDSLASLFSSSNVGKVIIQLKTN